MKQKICVLGEGAWGTAVATVLAANGHTVSLWCHDKGVAEEIQRFRVNNLYLPHISLQAAIEPTDNLEEAVAKASHIFLSTPVVYVRAVLEKARTFSTPEQTWILLNKGIEQHTSMVPSQIVDDVFSTDVKKVILSGPSFARDVAHKKITGIILAAHDKTLAQSVQKIIENSYIKTFYSVDVVGVQYAAAFKNVLALGMGILNGIGAAENTKSFFLSVGLHEISQVVKVVGGQQETAYGLSGVGDLILTSMGTQSRNVAFGYRLGKGESLADIVVQGALLPEGVNTVVSMNDIAQKYSLKLPICRAIHEVVVNEQPAVCITEALMKL